jgi:hypothetical protein
VSKALITPPELSAAIVWVGFGEDAGGYSPRLVGDRIDVRGDFPATFELSMYAAPPPKAMQLFLAGEIIPEPVSSGIAWGFIAAIDASADDTDIQREDIIGIDTSHVILFFDHDIATPPKDSEAWAMLTPVEMFHARFDQQVAALQTSTEPGYHLAQVNPEWLAAWTERLDCMWQDLCVQWIAEVPGDQARVDWDFERCTQRFPENPTCSAQAWPGEDGDEPASSRECREMHEGFVSLADCYSLIPEVPHYVPNPDGLAAPIEIELGMGLFDVGQ